MLGIDRLLQKIFSKKKEEDLDLQIKENYIHGLIFYNSYFDILSKALPRGSFCFIVGGWVRNRLINRPLGKNIDIDFIVTAPPMEVAKNLKKYINGSIFQFEKEKTVVSFIFQENDYNYRFDFSYLDISDIISSDLSYEEKEEKILDRLVQDLLSRDFTINAIAVNFDDTSGLSASHTTLIDPSNGFKDIQEGIVRPISLENIVKDPVRILRGYRLSLELDFKLDKEFEKFVKNNVDLLEKSPKERIRDEFLKIVSNENSYSTLEKLKENKVLSKVVSQGLEELSTYKNVEEILKKLDFIDERLKEDFGKIYFYQNFTDTTFLKLNALLFNLDENEFEKVCKERLLIPEKPFKFMKSTRKAAVEILKGQYRDFFQMNLFWYNYKDVAIYSFIMVLAVKSQFKDFILNIQKHYFENYLGKVVDEPLLSGSEIMRILDLKPSKEVGIIKEKLILAQLKGEVKTKEEAIQYVKNFCRR